jgi:hypothetical protein
MNLYRINFPYANIGAVTFANNNAEALEWAKALCGIKGEHGNSYQIMFLD